MYTDTTSDVAPLVPNGKTKGMQKSSKIAILTVASLIVIIVVIVLIVALPKENETGNDTIIDCNGNMLFVYDRSGTSKIYSMTGYNESSEASVIISSFCVNKTSEIILFTGNYSAGLSFCQNASLEDHTELCMLDVTTKTVFPGLIDTHVHIMSQGALTFKANVAGANSFAETIQRLREYIDTFADRIEGMEYWIDGRGWDQNYWNDFPPNTLPTRFDLDAVFGDKYKIYLTRIDGHAAWFNTAAMNAVPNFTDINNDDIEGGEILYFDDVPGNATGILVDTAMNFIRDHISKPENEEEEEEIMLENVINEMNMHGLVGGHDAGAPPKDHELFKRFVTDYPDKFNIRLYSMATSRLHPDNYTIYRYNDTNNRLDTSAVKFYLDGALGSWGAALIEPYCDLNSSGLSMYNNVTRYYNDILFWWEKGYHIGTHAIGDFANQLVTQAYSDMIDELNLEDHRLRIEHAQIVNMDDIKTIGEKQIIPIMQPTHATSDMVFVPSRLECNRTEGTRTRINGSYAWQSMLNASVPALGFGSDFPAVGVVDPFLGLYAAVTRQNETGWPQDGWLPWEKVSKYQALKGYTSDAAFCAFKENVSGTIEAGKFADFIIMDKDFFDLNEGTYNEIFEINVLQTYLGGRLVFDINNL